MTQILETIEAETSFEAEEIARAKFGDNIRIIKTEKIKQDVYFGLGQKDKVRITIIKDDSRGNSSHMQKSYSIRESEEYPESFTDTCIRETPSSFKPKTISVTASQIQKIYKDHSIKDRDSGNIRGIQEGDDEPIESTKNASNADDLIKTMNDLLMSRKEENLTATKIEHTSVINRKMEVMINHMDTLIKFLKEASANSSDFLGGRQILPQGLADIEKELLEMETPNEIIESLLKDLRFSCKEEELKNSRATLKALHDLLKSKIKISSKYTIKKSGSPQIIVLMGPTGVGKTTTLAKLAARFCFNPNQPIKSTILNIDFYKLGASAQLSTYASIFGIPLEDITSVASLDYCLNKHKDDDLIIVDTAGRSQYATDDLRELKTYLDRLPSATKYLTISSTSKYCDMKDIIASFSQVGFDHIILTKTDETRTIGPAVGMLLNSKKPIAYITHGQQVPEDYKVADFKFFKDKLFNNF